MIQFTASRHIVIGLNKIETEVETWTAQHIAPHNEKSAISYEADEAETTAWNYPSRAEAMKALSGFRHAVTER